jgi:choline dehydrogenase-like flavoprotein
MEGNNRLCDERHGADGPLHVSDPGHINDVSRWFVQAVQALGEPYNHDFNGPTQRGVGFYQFMNRSGKRSSAAYAFLAPLADHPDLTDPPQRAVRPSSRERPRGRGATASQGGDDAGLRTAR